jgi:hypothetical protein
MDDWNRAAVGQADGKGYEWVRMNHFPDLLDSHIELLPDFSPTRKQACPSTPHMK